MPVKRTDGRRTDELRPVSFEANYFRDHATLVSYGETRVLCYASIDERVPGWLLGSGHGWITAEYNMLPTASYPRQNRERNATGGRTSEIQRLIGRALRASSHLSLLPPLTIKIDCDVIIADGGTRTAAITGAFVSLASLIYAERHRFAKSPLKAQVAAVSVGLRNGEPLLDLDYKEDSSCEVDGNVVKTSTGELVDLSFTAEHRCFSQDELSALLKLADVGLASIFAEQAKLLPERLEYSP
ncbi:ribonuclease PH [bacterium]|nr:ribonuclease PH [bacterium]